MEEEEGSDLRQCGQCLPSEEESSSAKQQMGASSGGGGMTEGIKRVRVVKS